MTTLDNTMWDITVAETEMMGGIHISTADLTFSNGELTISNWIYNVDPGTYQEKKTKNSISFTALLQKLGTYPQQIFLVVGTATPEQIVGVIYNPNQSGHMMMNKDYYLFVGKPMPMSE
jgi:Icc-related predicted phosphoesterase